MKVSDNMNDRDKYFLDEASSIAKQSLCTRRKYGAVLVSRNGEFLSKGCNFISDNCDCLINGCPRDRNNSEHNTHDYTGCNSIHAEMVALLSYDNKMLDFIGGTLYLVGYDSNGERIDNAIPCPNCLKHLKHMYINKLVNYSGEHKL